MTSTPQPTPAAEIAARLINTWHTKADEIEQADPNAAELVRTFAVHLDVMRALFVADTADNAGDHRASTAAVAHGENALDSLTAR